MTTVIADVPVETMLEEPVWGGTVSGGIGGAVSDGTGESGSGGGGGMGGLATERLEAELKSFSAHLAAGLCRWLLMVAEYDRRRGFDDWECVSIEQWLSIHVSMSPSTARAHVMVARRLGELALVTAAFAEGRLSYSKVRALCRVATPDNEAEWVMTALHASASQLERITADTRRVLIVKQGGVAARQADERSLGWGWTDDGMLRVTALLPPETGVMLVRLIEAERARNSDRDSGLDARNADAFAAVLDRVGIDPDDDGGDGESGRRALVVVHRERDGTTRLDGGPPIPGEVADEIECGAETVTAWHSAAGISFDRRRRHPAVGLRRYLRSRDRCCVFPGCRQRRALAQHHIKEYVAEQGETTKYNMILLCARHHGAVHRRGWTVTGSAEDATLVFRRPDGRAFPVAAPVTGDPEQVVAANHANGLRPGPDTPSAASMGERYNHELNVWIYANSIPAMTYTQPPAHSPDDATPGPATANTRHTPSPDPVSAEAGAASRGSAPAETHGTDQWPASAEAHRGERRGFASWYASRASPGFASAESRGGMDRGFASAESRGGVEGGVASVESRGGPDQGFASAESTQSVSAPRLRPDDGYEEIPLHKCFVFDDDDNLLSVPQYDD